MRTGDRQTTGALRSVLAALENAEAVPQVADDSQTSTSAYVAGAAAGLGAGDAPRRLLSPADERALIEREIADLRSSAAVLADAGQHERSSSLIQAAATLEEALTG